MSENKLFNINEGHFLSLCKKKIPLNSIYLLEMIKQGKEPEDDSYMANLQWLQRKGYIDNKQQITQYGQELYDSLFIEGEQIVAKRTKKEKNSLFEIWWGIFPSSDGFETNGRLFKGTRKLTQKKADCEKLFNVLINSQFTGEQIIQATRVHIGNLIENSFKSRRNALTYLPNSYRYLNEKLFEPFLNKEQEEESKIDFEI